MHPRHRGGCADFYYAPHQDERVDLKVPVDVRGELELAAARAGLTWNDQLCYVGELFLGLRPPDFDDPRSVEEWRTLMSDSLVWIDTEGDWVPFNSLGEHHEHEAIPPAGQRT
ncbi:MAG TPA: hypothetical protein VLA67_09790 [Nitrospiraceae bacterium]|nr:hypothetical protein [Nitrospiraceae bacterium]